MAYKNGTSTRKNALIHAKNRYFLRLDFRRFFESIKRKDVILFCDIEIKKIYSNWSNEDSELFSDLVCYKDSLVMGAVTSPKLSNLMCFELDEKLSELSNSLDIKYSRYSDDIYFSSSKKNILFSITPKLEEILKAIKYPKKLTINKNKTYHSSKKNRTIITGLKITNDKNVSIGRDKKRQVRSLVFRWDTLDTIEKKRVSGYISYIQSIENDFINKLCIKYGSDKINEIVTFK